MSRRLKIIFTISVLLNVLLIGVVTGACYKRWDGPPGFADARDPRVDNKVARAMMEARKEQDVAHKRMKQAKRELVDVLAAPSFDEARFDAVSEKIHAAQDELFKVRNAATLKMAREMTAEERQEMAAHMQAMSERYGRFKDGERAGPGRRGPREGMPPPPPEE